MLEAGGIKFGLCPPKFIIKIKSRKEKE